MRYKLSVSTFRDWLDGYLRIAHPRTRYYVTGRDDGDGLAYTHLGGVIDIPMQYITPDLVDVEVRVLPSLRDDFPRAEAEQHAEALRAAIDKRFRGASAIPDEPQAGAPIDDWFQWRKDCNAVGVTIRLDYIAERTGYTHGYLRNKHAEWKAENT